METIKLYFNKLRTAFLKNTTAWLGFAGGLGAYFVSDWWLITLVGGIVAGWWLPDLIETWKK